MILKCLYFHKLKQIHPQYGDVTIRDEANMGDPTFLNVDENMDENNYDEDDLMPIDRCQSSARCETENEHAPAERNKPASFFNT